MNILEVRNLSVVLKAGKQKKTLVDGHLYAFFLRGQCGPEGRGLYADTV